MSWLEREGKGERLGLGGNRWKRVKSMTIDKMVPTTTTRRGNIEAHGLLQPPYVARNHLVVYESVRNVGTDNGRAIKCRDTGSRSSNCSDTSMVSLSGDNPEWSTRTIIDVGSQISWYHEYPLGDNALFSPQKVQSRTRGRVPENALRPGG